MEGIGGRDLVAMRKLLLTPGWSKSCTRAANNTCRTVQHGVYLDGYDMLCVIRGCVATEKSSRSVR